MFINPLKFSKFFQEMIFVLVSLYSWLSSLLTAVVSIDSVNIQVMFSITKRFHILNKSAFFLVLLNVKKFYRGIMLDSSRPCMMETALPLFDNFHGAIYVYAGFLKGLYWMKVS